MEGITDEIGILRVMLRKTKGLKTLKIQRDGLLLCLTIPHRNEKSREEGAWTGQHKNHEYPFKIIRSFLDEGC
jgi:hypothetical protein